MQHHLNSLVQLLYLDVVITQQEEQKEKKVQTTKEGGLEAGRHHKKGRKRKREKGKKSKQGPACSEWSRDSKSQPKSQREIEKTRHGRYHSVPMQVHGRKKQPPSNEGEKKDKKNSMINVMLHTCCC